MKTLFYMAIGLGVGSVLSDKAISYFYNNGGNVPAGDNSLPLLKLGVSMAGAFIGYKLS